MMEKHTSGPWRAEFTNSAKLSWVVVSAVSLTANGSTAIIGHCAGDDKDANARIIAELPEMLAGLDEAILQIEYLHGKFGETGSGNAVLARLHAIVAKARGEAP